MSTAFADRGFILLSDGHTLNTPFQHGLDEGFTVNDALDIAIHFKVMLLLSSLTAHVPLYDSIPKFFAAASGFPTTMPFPALLVAFSSSAFP